MAYRYAKRKTTHARYALMAGAAIVFFPWSLTPVDFRAAFGGARISAHHASPAFAALEDLNADFGRPVDLARATLPPLNEGRTVNPRDLAPPTRRHLALAGLTIHLPAREVIKPEVMIARATPPPGELYHDPESTLGGVAERLVKRELAAAAEARVIAGSLGTRIVVGGTHADQTKMTEPTPAATAPTEFKPTLTSLATSPAAVRAVWIDGQIEMTGGLGWIGPETDLVVRRTVDGQTREKGRIWVTEGKFEIHVSQPTGSLVAELQTRDGRVLGRGEVNLVGASAALPTAANRIGDLKIALRPTTEVASLRAISGYSHGNQTLALNDAHVEIDSVAQAMGVDDEGFVTEPTVGAGSSYVARATAPKHWPSLVVASADRPRDVRLLSNGMVKALLELSLKKRDRRDAAEEGLIWGQVTKSSRPVADAHVEMTQGLEPIYFNDLYLPDRTLNATGSNGLFAFVNVKAGVQAVRVRHGESAYPAQIFATEVKHVSYLEMNLRDKVVADFTVSDVLGGNRVTPANLKLVGTDATMSTRGQDVVELNTAGDTTMVEADAGPDFEVSRATLSADPRRVDLPIVRREWLRGLYGARAIEPKLDRGAVVGFVDGQDFEVEMSGGLLKERLPIVYFDAVGKPVAGPTGIAGGGFAILNAPTGLQTVQIHPTQARASFTQVVVAEPNLVHVMTWSPPPVR